MQLSSWYIAPQPFNATNVCLIHLCIWSTIDLATYFFNFHSAQRPQLRWIARILGWYWACMFCICSNKIQIQIQIQMQTLFNTVSLCRWTPGCVFCICYKYKYKYKSSYWCSSSCPYVGGHRACVCSRKITHSQGLCITYKHYRQRQRPCTLIVAHHHHCSALQSAHVSARACSFLLDLIRGIKWL